ncbi:MAG: YceI family protein [Acidobacteriota bacterium]
MKAQSSAFRGLVTLAPMLMAILTCLAEERWHFTIRPEQSRFTIKVGKAGFFKMFGHNHLVVVQGFKGSVEWQPKAPEKSKVRLRVGASSLAVEDPGIKRKEREKIQKEMEEKALVIEQYPDIRFESTELHLGGGVAGELKGNLIGRLSLRGVTSRVEIPLRLTVSEAELHVWGRFKLKGSDYGVPRISAAGGAVKTKDQLELTFNFLASREKGPP